MLRTKGIPVAFASHEYLFTCKRKTHEELHSVVFRKNARDVAFRAFFFCKYPYRTRMLRTSIFSLAKEKRTKGILASNEKLHSVVFRKNGRYASHEKLHSVVFKEKRTILASHKGYFLRTKGMLAKEKRTRDTLKKNAHPKKKRTSIFSLVRSIYP